MAIKGGVIWLGVWSADKDQSDVWFYLRIYAGLQLSAAVVVVSQLN